jgi:hypothetical protein
MKIIPSIATLVRACFACLVPPLSCATSAEDKPAGRFRAGAAAVDISPETYPRIIAGSFLEKRGDKLTDPLFVRAFVLDDGAMQIALAVVDTCMMEQSLIDEAKALASAQCGIPVERMMISATHTHAAPAAMSCLGTRKDTAYAKFLTPKIAEAIVLAHGALQPARVGWGGVDDWRHTHNRRWIRLPGKEIVDPYGGATGRAHMHPGHLSPDVVGPSGPVDPRLSVISLQTPDGKPIGVIANYSQHYFGSSPVSADYYGHFCRRLASLLGQPGDGNGPFVCAMSQGTSGDLMWMDYGAERPPVTLDDYAAAVAASAKSALDGVTHHDHATLGMIERTLQLNYRAPDAERLAWARPIAARIEEDLPKDKEEVYAREALILHERQNTRVKLQAIRIGDLSIATLPNEVYAITGLKLRALSPLAAHFNIGLANGAEGYIPPPEQHTLGGYTTWPARTAGLEVAAEPKIVASLSRAIAELAGKPPRDPAPAPSPYAEVVLASNPVVYARCDDLTPPLRNETESPTRLEPAGGHAFYLPGPGSGRGYGKEAALKPSAFSAADGINRALQLAGGHLEIINLEIHKHQDDASWSLALWFWLGHESGASRRSGALIGDITLRQDEGHRVKITAGDHESADIGRADDWHFAVLIQQAGKLRVHIDGNPEPVLDLDSASSGLPRPLVLGRDLEGRLDEITLWNRAIDTGLITKLWRTAGIGGG